jgi:hypothetical protein
MSRSSSQPRVIDRVKKLGHCVELVSIDPHFHDISIGLFIKDGLLTVFSYSQINGTEKRIEQIRDRCTKLGDVVAVHGTKDQLRLTSDLFLERALRFMFIAAVEKDPKIPVLSGPISAPDTKTKLTLFVEGCEENGRIVYTVSAVGKADRPELRVSATVGGFIRYSDCERVGKDKFAFPDGKRYDNYARLILPLARNVSAVETQLQQDELAGQMTTQTLGFSQN